MQTPIFDFLRRYGESGASRFHMPGHKGCGALGVEKFDITEISGADVLYSPSGIILESENNASELFGTAHTYYSAEGSTLGIKAMLAIALRAGKDGNRRILAARNAHKAFIYAAALLDFEIDWIMPSESTHIASAIVTPCQVKEALQKSAVLPCAVYITTPDYLGNIQDVKGISEVLEEFGIPLLVDNAHGAYLAFLEENMHPIKLGAAMCCDSAHKTLPVLTGGAYLHISKKFEKFADGARDMLSLFASTSPSYLILASLDAANKYIAEGYKEKLANAVSLVGNTKRELSLLGFAPEPSEPLKIVIRFSKYGLSGEDAADRLRDFGCECELSDKDYLVLMATPENSASDFDRLIDAFKILAPKESITSVSVKMPYPEPVLSIREAIFAPSEIIPTENSAGRILSSPCVSCPPAVPIAISGERISHESVKLFERYGIERVSVVKEDFLKTKYISENENEKNI